MCDFCKTIYPDKVAYNEAVKGRLVDALIRDGNEVKIHVPCEDYFYSFSVPVNFCPFCGRSLTGDDDKGN